MKLKDVISPFYVWKRAFQKPYTNTNPLDTREGSDNYRGFHANDIEACIGCGTCEAVCQNAAIDMVPVDGVDTTMSDSGLRPKIDYGRCCWCALCVDVCTTSSLRLTNEYTWFSSDDKEDFRFIPGVDKKSWDNWIILKFLNVYNCYFCLSRVVFYSLRRFNSSCKFFS